MTRSRDEILDPKLTPAEREEAEAMARALERSRPVPRRAFMANLAKRLQLKLAEWRELHETAGLLKRARPVPGQGFQRQVARQLSGRTAAPERPGLLIGALGGSGFLLLMIAVLGLAGIGPLAPG